MLKELTVDYRGFCFGLLLLDIVCEVSGQDQIIKPVDEFTIGYTSWTIKLEDLTDLLRLGLHLDDRPCEIEKRRSGRRSGGHRKHSDGGYSDTSSGGSYLDETDRERDRQLAFSQSGQDRDRQDKEREELESATHGSFDLRMQPYGQDWIHGRMCEAEIQRDPQWE
ncbi:hypothetical protein EYF80_017997 [Liparis tanakae]|uniref:Uncharacterized protein n=1 Tax=Liparis tanakae TaxID=230148 RepID=A0A4Z2I189_9TELE|nr:hypothetical protein EYF80_017997 [Liparis tanakae]